MATTRCGAPKRQKKAKKRKKLPPLSQLKRKALRLWSQQVRDMHGNVCALCGKPHPRLNAHHIESKTNYVLRFDVLNGIAVCPEHHVFGRDAVHKGIFFYEWLQKHRPRVIQHLRMRRVETVKYDRQTLNEIIEGLSSPAPPELYEIMGLKPPGQDEELGGPEDVEEGGCSEEPLGSGVLPEADRVGNGTPDGGEDHAICDQ